ncbi:MAG TPA: PASTA domain-containing protein [candidate division WOR-3 bacterium]|uniref:PASTA domain-containing protein n=1 Tax=candidate division WOR-3 bacterium TaxID=2052148 RepID=A0A9C9ELU0_UNCW3|nr:PASTA domain-containing protein [candidate division WOR-3 bacterium]
MYYNGAKIFVVSFIVSLFTSIIVCVLFFFVIMPLTKPSGDIVVPDLLGSTTEQARVITETRGLLLVVGGEEEDEKIGENLICRQTPLPGSMVGRKTTVTVFISKGSGKLVLPDFKGQGLSEATVKLSEMGLKVGEVKSEENSEVDKDKIISTIPPAGSRVKKGDVISVVLSRGVELVKVPRLIGKSLSTAKRLIENNGFKVGNVSWEVSIDYNVGIVMRQSPGAGRMAKKGSAINLVVATVLE